MRLLPFLRVRTLAIAAVIALVASATAAAGGNDYKLQMTAAGKLAARTAILTKSDLGIGWSGGPVKPDLSNDDHCANYNPKYSDLVVTGAAASKFTEPGVQIQSDSSILGSAEMAALDWQRSVASPNFLSCARETLKKAAAKGNTRIVSVRKIVVPRIGDQTVAIRTVFDVTSKTGAVVHIAVDVLAFTKGHAEVGLTTTMAVESVPTLWPNEIVLAKLLAARVRV
jgi:hypothetical protein